MTIERKVLVVARWPLGGIRTYMRYMFSHFSPNYKLTLLATSTHEDSALAKDAAGYGADLKLVKVAGTRSFVLEIFSQLRRNRYDLILSQGFISAVAVYMANLLFRVPHVLTIHGIVEHKYMCGRFGRLKRLLLGRILSDITVLYAVSNDILEHLYEQFPDLSKKRARTIVIQNGIEPEDFCRLPVTSQNLREMLGVDDPVFLFGFFGRFMPQKGFDLLIDAIDRIRKQMPEFCFAVAAVGSGDYMREYQTQIKIMGLEQYFYFLPFQPQVHHLYPQVDAIVMPSRWEACPLLPMEVLCMGTPLIASDCMGLRETVADTPATVFRTEDVNGLVESMLGCIRHNNVDVFLQYVPQALERYDVAKSSLKLMEYFECMPELK